MLKSMKYEILWFFLDISSAYIILDTDEIMFKNVPFKILIKTKKTDKYISTNKYYYTTY